MNRLVKFLGRLTWDWGSLVALITGIVTVSFFVFSILSTNNTQAEQIKNLDYDVTVLKDAVPRIERALGRIEGKLGIYNK